MSNYEKLIRALMAFTAEQLNQFLESEEASTILQSSEETQSSQQDKMKVN